MTSTHHVSPTAADQRTYTHSPITALAFYSLPNDTGKTQNLLLSGQDTHLKIYSTTTTTNTTTSNPSHPPLASLQVFPAQPIQGLTTCPTTASILLWGGPWLALVPAALIAQLLLSPSSPPDVIIQILHAPDWIYHAAFLAPSAIVIITAHNEVLPLRRNITTSTTTWSWGQPRAPRASSRPALYAARLVVVGGEAGEVLVAAGTVFGEMVVWRCWVSEREDEEGGEVGEVLYVFTGHEGSIFGVDISPEVRIGGRRRRLLASCSDDRTVRVWDISGCVARRREAGGREKLEVERTLFTEARETGFGENGVADLEAQAGGVSTEPVAVAMGHVSRIWNVRFARCSAKKDKDVHSMTIYSLGEDATAQRWRLDLDAPSSSGDGAGVGSSTEAPLIAKLTHEAIVHRHSGKHIWSVAILEPTWPDTTTTTTTTLVATGGSDGKINVAEEIIPPEQDTRAVLLDISGTEVVRHFVDPDAASGEATLSKATKRKKAKAEDEPFVVYALVAEGSTLATTSSGRLFSGLLDGSEMAWSEVSMSRETRADLRQYQILRSAGAGVALLGSTSGNLYLYRDGVVSHVCKVSRKISDIFTFGLLDLTALGLWDYDEWRQMPIIVSTMGSPSVTLFILDRTQSGAIVLESHSIELDAGFVPTAVGCCNGYFVFGSRIGAIILYKPTYKDGSKAIERIARIERRLTKDAVSCIIPLPPRGGKAAPYFLTTSRDGHYRIYEITTSQPTKIILRHEALPPLGPNIESAIFTPGQPIELTLAGFRSKDFVVWNETRQLEHATVECGGAFRSFTHRVDAANPEALAFVWTRASRTCVYAQTALSQRVVRRGGHGREIKAVAVAAEGNLVATGAEDTTVRIWSYEPSPHPPNGNIARDDLADGKGSSSGGGGGSLLRCLAVIEKHTAGIQCLRWAGAHYLLSSGGSEELCIWRVTRLDDRSAYDGLAVVCEGVYPDRTRDGDLRIMGFDVDVLPREGDGEGEEEVLCISLVLSNSTLKTYRYSRVTGFVLLAQGRYTGACLLQIRHLYVLDGGGSGGGGEQMHVLTAATDGHLALWKTVIQGDNSNDVAAEVKACSYELVTVVALHQSSIKSLDLRRLLTSSPPSSRPRPPPASYVVVTGGDDNALGCVVLEWAGGVDGCYAVASRALANGAHAAAVTGLSITGVDQQLQGQLQDVVFSVSVYTASTDQRVKTWRVLVAGGEGGRVKGVKLVRNAYSGVADAGDLEVLEGGREVVVVGVGMEIWRL